MFHFEKQCTLVVKNMRIAVIVYISAGGVIMYYAFLLTCDVVSYR